MMRFTLLVNDEITQPVEIIYSESEIVSEWDDYSEEKPTIPEWVQAKPQF